MTVAIVKSSYENIKSGLQKAFDLLKYEPQKEKILLKPNVGSQHGSIEAGDYVPAFLCGAIAEIFKDRKIIIGEGTATGMDFNLSMRKYGYFDLANQNSNIELVNLNNVKERIPVEWKYGTLQIPKLVFDCEYINIAKMKTHYFCHVSMAMKNQKGIIPVPTKKKFHQMDLQDAILHLNLAVKPDFNVIDGIIAMEGNGPNSTKPIGGKTVKLGLLVCGRDVLETDNVAMQVMKLDRSKSHVPDVPTEIVGEKLSDISVPFDPPTLGQQYRLFNFHMQLRSACSGCMQSFLGVIDLTKQHPLSLESLKRNIEFFRHGVIKPIILYFGQDCHLFGDKTEKNAKMVCVGVCTRELAKKHDLPYIPGCPPSSEEMTKFMWSKKKLEQLRPSISRVKE